MKYVSQSGLCIFSSSREERNCYKNCCRSGGVVVVVQATDQRIGIAAVFFLFAFLPTGSLACLFVHAVDRSQRKHVSDALCPHFRREHAVHFLNVTFNIILGMLVGSRNHVHMKALPLYLWISNGPKGISAADIGISTGLALDLCGGNFGSWTRVCKIMLQYHSC